MSHFYSNINVARMHSRSYQGFNDFYQVTNDSCVFDVDCMISCPDSHLRFCITNRCSCKLPSFSERCDNGNHALYVIGKRFFDKNMGHLRCMLRTPKDFYFHGSFYEPSNDCCVHSIEMSYLEDNKKFNITCDEAICNKGCIDQYETTGTCHTVLKMCICHTMSSNIQTSIIFNDYQCTISCRNKFGFNHIGVSDKFGSCYCRKKLDPPPNACKIKDCNDYCMKEVKMTSGDCIDDLRCVCSGIERKNCTWNKSHIEGRYHCLNSCSSKIAEYDVLSKCCICLRDNDKYVYSLQ